MDNVVIICKMPFPEGYAATIRFTTYSRGLIENGVTVNLLCIKPTESKNKITNTLPKGNYQGINFEYTSGKTSRSNFLFFRPFYNLKGFLNSLKRIISIKKQHKTKAIILIGPFGVTKELIYYLITRLLNIKYIQERTEFPFITKKKGLSVRINLWLYHKISCKLFDGMILISSVLLNYFQDFVSKKAKLIVIPIVVDPGRFKGNSLEITETDYIAYCGSMDSNKDGIDYLIDAFYIIAPKFPNVNLKMIGRTDFTNFNKIQDRINELGLKNRVLFTGRVNNEEMAKFLKNAKLLALARPETIQSKANFPTKIGEYCATGNPIVTTRVGSITDYLIDGKNAYLAEPGNSIVFAAKMEEALSNYSKAMVIGAEGEKLAYTTFNYIYQGKRLTNYLCVSNND